MSATTYSEPTTLAGISHKKALVIFSGLMLGVLLAALDQTIVSTALPTIVGDLGGASHLSWVVTAYILASTVSTPLWGKLGDLYGRKRFFQASIVVFLVGSVLSGTAHTMAQLIAWRAMQGLGGGGLMVLAQAIIGDVVPPRERGRYQGLFGAVFGVATVIGPLIGGSLTQSLSWRWVFYVNVPVAIAAIIVTTAVLPGHAARVRHVIDYAGAALLTVAATALVLLTTWGGSTYAWTSTPIIGLAVVGVGALGSFAAVERRAVEPVVPLRLFRDRTFNVASAVSFLIGLALFGAVSFLPLYLQLATGASPTMSGLLLLPMMAGMLVTSIGSGQVIAKTGQYRWYPVIGTALAGFGMYLLSQINVSTPQWSSSLDMVLLGAGIGLVMQVMVLAAQNSAAQADMGAATSAVSFSRSIGGSFGVALFGSVLATHLVSSLRASLPASTLHSAALRSGQALESLTPATLKTMPTTVRHDVVAAYAHGIGAVFAYAVPAMVIGFGVSLLLRSVPLREHSHHPTLEALELGTQVAPVE